jgi:hypothetical protein
VIIPRETMKRLYGVGATLAGLKPDPQAIGQLRELVTSAAQLTQRVSVAELDGAYEIMGATPERTDEAGQLIAATERELTELWSGPTSDAAYADLTSSAESLARIRSAAQQTVAALEKLDGQVAEVDGVIRQGGQHLVEADKLLPAVASAAGQYGDWEQFERLFEQARTEAVTGAALVFQAYKRFDEVCATAKDSLVRIGVEVGNPDAVKTTP